MLYMWKIQ
ncbi:hypothetical protein VULLAG_LOCUS4325 [Vulpes lagopus]